MFRPVVLGILLAGLSASVAWAEPGRTAALLPRMRAETAPELRVRLHEAIARGIGAGTDGLSVAETQVRLTAPEDLTACDGAATCATRAAVALHAERLVSSDIDIAGKQYAFHLRLIDAMGHELARLDESCDICSLKEAEDSLKKAVARLLVAPRSSQPVLAQPMPSPASSSTPIAPPATSPTPSTWTAPSATQAPQITRTAKGLAPYRPIAIGSIAAGLVAIAIGVPLMVIDGNPTCDLPDPRRNCPEVYSTLAAGGSLVSLGVGGVAASGVLFYLDWRQKRGTR